VIFLTKKDDLQDIFKNIPKKETLQVGDIIFGKVIQTTDKIAIISINTKDKNKVLSPTSSGILFVNNVSSEYIDKLPDLVRKNDIIKAKIIDMDKFIFKLTINEDDLGVIKANCHKCKQPLTITNHMKCLKCKTEQKRKIPKM